MKSVLFALLAFSTLSAFAGSNDQTGRMLGATCNSTYGIGQVEIAVYNQKSKSLVINRLNVVNESLCSIGSGWHLGTPSKLVDMAFISILGSNVSKLHNFRINSHNVVTDIEEVVANTKELKNLYKKFNLLNLYDYGQVDFRIVDLDQSLRSKEAIESIASLLDMAEMD